MKSRIYLRAVLAEINQTEAFGTNRTFDLIYARADGSFGEHKGCIRHFGSGRPQPHAQQQATPKQTRKGGMLYVQLASGEFRELHVPLLIAYNGHLIDHRF